MDEYSHNSIHHGVKKKNEGKHRRSRRLVVLGYALFVLAYVLLFTVPVQMYPALAGVPFFLYALYRITWWRLDYDYDYTLSHGELTVEKVYSATRRKKLQTVPLKSAIRIAPHSGKLPQGTVEDYRSGESAPNGYAITYRMPDGKESILLFDATAKMVKTMAKYCPDTVVAEGLPQ